jgi:hypothetical protein
MRALAVVGLVAGLSFGCNGDERPEVSHSSGKPDGSAGSSGGSAGTDGGGGISGASDAAEEFTLPEASNIAVRVGIVPVAASPGDAGPSHVDESIAHQDVVAAGSRAVKIARRWDELFSGPGQPIEPEWQYLSGLAKLHAGNDRALLLSLAVVDRTLDARPAGLADAWDSAQTLAAMHGLIDRSFATFGAELRYLSIGLEVDRFLGVATPNERAAFIAFAKDAFDHARGHALAPSNLVVGVSISAGSFLQAGAAPADLTALASAGDLTFVVYHALDQSSKPRPATAAAGDLDALWKAVGGPVVLEEVAYPSEPEEFSSLEQQRAFYDSLFVALLSRRDRFPFVAVRGSNERSLPACEADALALGEPDSPALIAAYCSFGLRGPDGANKPAWASVVDALVTFSSP